MEKRNVAWRVLDAKFFGLPQQRRRLYVVAGGKDFKPENVLFEIYTHDLANYPSSPLVFEKEGHHFEVFREYTDCLYSAYGTKWNGNAAAYNGSLFVVQDQRIRRLSPLETERLMGFPDNYTYLSAAKKTNRYQATGNSWAVPVVRWLGERLINGSDTNIELDPTNLALSKRITQISEHEFFYNFGKNDIVEIGDGQSINCTGTPENSIFSSMQDIVSPEAPQDIYISPVGCFGIVRRKRERNLKINPRLEEILLSISEEMSPEEIEKRSRVQQRGRFSSPNSEDMLPEERAHFNDVSTTSAIVAICENPPITKTPKRIEQKPVPLTSPSKQKSAFANIDESILPEGQLSIFDLI